MYTSAVRLLSFLHVLFHFTSFTREATIHKSKEHISTCVCKPTVHQQNTLLTVYIEDL